MEPIKVLTSHYGCNNESDLQKYLGECVSLLMITEAMEIYGRQKYNEAIWDAVKHVRLYSKGGVDVGHLLNKDSILELLK